MRSVIVILLTCVVGCVSAQNCLDLLSAAYSKMEKPIPDKKGKCAFLEYEVKSVSPKDKGVDKPIISTVHYRIWLKKDYVVVRSNLADLFKDNEITVAVNHLAKIVTIGYSTVPVKKESDLLSLKTMREALLLNSTMQSCTADSDNPENRIVILVIEGNARKFSTVRKLKFVINSRSQDLLSAKIYFTADRQDVSRIDYKFLKTDYDRDYDNSVFKKNILNYVVTNKGDLLPEFSNYQFVDLRKQSLN